MTELKEVTDRGRHTLK